MPIDQKIAEMPRRHWTRWPWSMLPVPMRRRVGIGVIILRGPNRHETLRTRQRIDANKLRCKGGRVKGLRP